MPVTDEDRSAELLRRRHAKPFVPFTITFADGGRQIVREPLSFTAVNGKVILPGRIGSGGVPVGQVVDVADYVEPKPMSDAESELRDDLIGRLTRRPFQPFTIHMRDRTRHDIVRRLQAAMGLTRGRIVNEAMTAGVDFHIGDVQAIQRLDMTCANP